MRGLGYFLQGVFAYPRELTVCGSRRLAVRVAEIPVATVINLPTRSVSLRFLGNNYPERLRPPELLSLIHPISQRLFGLVG
jgi:hypothetical protein